jgi:hypothetical protein
MATNVLTDLSFIVFQKTHCKFHLLCFIIELFIPSFPSLRSYDVSFTIFNSFPTGADLNKVDKYGRSPLHVASAVDYVDMVEFLLENGAHVDAETFGECQTALHFAAKNDAVNAMKMLLAHKSDINCTDYKDRTPLQV